MLYYELQAELKFLIEKEYEDREAGYLARQVLKHASGLSATHLTLANRAPVPSEIDERARALALRLTNGEPWQYITGEADFCGHTFAVGPGVLIPRPETEMLVEEAIKFGDTLGRPVRVLDACTGSGCIAHSIALARPAWEVAGFDISLDALAYADKNKVWLGSSARIFQADLFGPLEALASAGSVDILVSNPPYVPAHEAASLAKHVRDFEPEIALFAPDEDALVFYKRLADSAAHILAHMGMILAEVHAPFALQTAALFSQFGSTNLVHDVFGKERALRCIIRSLS